MANTTKIKKLQLPAIVLETLFRGGAKFGFVCPVASPRPRPLLTFNVVVLPGPRPKHWATTLNGGGGFLGELEAVLWVEVILTVEEWLLGEFLNNFGTNCNNAHFVNVILLQYSLSKWFSLSLFSCGLSGTNQMVSVYSL